MTDAVPPTMWLLVGLPAVGKTTRARQIEADHGALRLTPDDWLLAVLGTVTVADDVRSALEGQLLDTAVPALRGGVDVIVDFGMSGGGRDGRTALRWMAAQLGARSVVELLDIDEMEQLRRAEIRASMDPRWALPAHQLRQWRQQMEWPAPDELADGPLDPPPPGASWGEWAARWWPGLRVVAESPDASQR